MSGERKNEQEKIRQMEVTGRMVSDPDMDRRLREGLKKEADEIMDQIENDPELQDIKAPDDLYDRIVAGLKEKGLWEEPSDEEVLDLLSEKDQEALNMGRKAQNKREKRRKRWAKMRKHRTGIAAAVGVACLVAVGGGTEASRSYVQRMWSLIVDGQLTIGIDGNENSNRSLSVEEEKIYRKIQESLGVVPLTWTYSPDSMILKEYEIKEETFSSAILYEINGEPLTVQMYRNDRVDSRVAKFDGRIIKTEIIDAVNLEVQIWQLYNWKESKAYITQFKYNDGFYVITGEIDDKIFAKIIQSINFYKNDIYA